MSALSKRLLSFLMCLVLIALSWPVVGVAEDSEDENSPSAAASSEEEFSQKVDLKKTVIEFQ